MLGVLPAGMDLASCAYPTSMPKTNAPRAKDRTRSEMFILSFPVRRAIDLFGRKRNTPTSRSARTLKAIRNRFRSQHDCDRKLTKSVQKERMGILRSWAKDKPCASSASIPRCWGHTQHPAPVASNLIMSKVVPQKEHDVRLSRFPFTDRRAISFLFRFLPL
jgi:hypothetical protein